MSQPAILVAIDGTQAQSWLPLLRERGKGRDMRFWPDGIGDRSDIGYAFVWRPPRGLLASLPNLKAILNVGAGVDALLTDPTLPDVPLARVAHPDLTSRVTGYVVLHVLAHHNRTWIYAAQQRERIWKEHQHPSPGEVAVGVMGMGAIGGEAAQVLARLGFRVAGWSRTSKSVPGIECFHGDAQLDAFLARTARPARAAAVAQAQARRRRRRRVPGQRRPWRGPGRCRHSHGLERGCAVVGDARRVSAGAAAAGQPVVVASAGDADAACGRRYFSGCVRRAAVRPGRSLRARRAAGKRGRSCARLLRRNGMRLPTACLAFFALLAAPLAEVQAQQLSAQFPLKGVDGTPIANHRLAPELAGRAALLPGTVVAGNPDGDVTLLQFYDLNCPYCRRAAQDIDELIRADKSLKMVFVPYPILSSQSVEGGRVELALREMGARHFLEFRSRIYKARGTIDGARSLAVVKEMGIDPVKVIELANQPRVTETLKAHAQFASAAKLFATPSYVVAGVAIVGHPGPNTLRGVVSAVRKCKAVVC
jgi:protein-disulfide isomerase